MNMLQNISEENILHLIGRIGVMDIFARKGDLFFVSMLLASDLDHLMTDINTLPLSDTELGQDVSFSASDLQFSTSHMD